MNWPAGLFDTFHRIGFQEKETPGQPDRPDRAENEGFSARYSLGGSFRDFAPEIKRGNAPFLLFIDQPVEIGRSGIRKISRFLSRNGSTPGMTFKSRALERIYGLEPSLPGKNQVAQQIRPVQKIPSWGCILNRSFVAANDLLNSNYKTLEFFLFEISTWLEKRDAGVLLFESVELDFDARIWAKDLLRNSAAALASDYSLFVEKHSNKTIPPQFRIELVGEYIPTPDLKPGTGGPSNPPVLSVICPAYKSGYFGETLRSIVNQTREDWELVVVVDGPPPLEEEKILRELKKRENDPRIRYYTQQNQGTGPTRRRLTELARGEFVISIDDDDLFAPETLEVFLAAIRTYPEVSIFRGGARLIGLVDRYLKPRQRILVNGISNDLFEVNQPWAIRREAIERLGGFDGDEAFRGAGEDSDFFHKADQARLTTRIIDRPLYYRRLNTGNQTLSIRPEEGLAHIKGLNRRHLPLHWQLDELAFEEHGDFVAQTSIYRHDSLDREVVCSTRYFNYQTLGRKENVLIDFEITSACNARCRFCPRDEVGIGNRHVSREIVEALAENIKKEKGPTQVILCGIGEPTLHPDLEEITSVLYNAGAKVCLTTNGSRMTPELFSRLIALGMTQVNFSLNAASAQTHRRVSGLKNFREIRANLLEIVERREKEYPGVELQVSFVLCRENRHEVNAFVDEWQERRISRIWIHPANNRAGLLDPNISPEDLARLRDRFNDDDRVLVDVFQHTDEEANVCKIARSLDFISVDGDLQLCAMDYPKNTGFGNVGRTALRRLRLEKIKKYLQGRFDNLCRMCDFCPGEIANRYNEGEQSN